MTVVTGSVVGGEEDGDRHENARVEAVEAEHDMVSGRLCVLASSNHIQGRVPGSHACPRQSL